MFIEQIGLHVQHLFIILNSIVNIIEGATWSFYGSNIFDIEKHSSNRELRNLQGLLLQSYITLADPRKILTDIQVENHGKKQKLNIHLPLKEIFWVLPYIE